MANIPTVTQSQGTAATTQNPQLVGEDQSLNSTSGNLQAPSSDNINTSNTTNGIPLGTQLTNNAPLVSDNSSTVAQSSSPKAVPHHTNIAGIIIVAVLIVAAIGVFISITQASKNTTKKLLAN